MNYVVVDLEWNQAMSSKSSVFNKLPIHLSGEIIEIGAVKLDSSFRLVDTYKSFIKTSVGKRLHGRVKELTHISNADIVNARQFTNVMHEFRNGRVDILVATDIVSRGIDIDDIPLVLNYDVPNDAEDYVHRIGRTARAANEGMAITFISDADQGKFYAIEKFLEKEIYKMPLPEGMEAPAYEPQKNARKPKRRHYGKRPDRRNGTKRNKPKQA